MASVNIYVTDELKERMGKEANWSDVCRRAIEAELTRLANGSSQTAAPLTTETADWKQLTFDAPLVDQGVVLKLSTPSNPPVVLLSDWLSLVNQQIGGMQINGGRFRQVLDGTFPTELLGPGRDWLSGRLKIEQRLVFSYPPSEESAS